MRLTTLRILALATTFLVVAAVTCLATFADGTPSPPEAVSLPACAASSLDLRARGTTFAFSTATVTFAVENVGDACLLERVPRLSAVDASGRPIALVLPKRTGVMRFVLRPLELERGGRATFTVVGSLQGPACAAIANVSLAVRDGSLSTAVRQTICTRDDGSNVSISFFVSDTGASPIP